MNKFKVSIKQAGESEYNEIKGAVFPFNYANLLDEQLDEGYLTVRGSDVKLFLPTTEIKIEINTNGNVQSKFFVVGNDTPSEYPNGSGQYKHGQIYIIERTKLLEGIVCQSLTFTNSLGTLYSDTLASYVEPIKSELSFGSAELQDKAYISPQLLGSKLKVKSLVELGLPSVDASPYHSIRNATIKKISSGSTEILGNLTPLSNRQVLDNEQLNTSWEIDIEDVSTTILYEFTFRLSAPNGDFWDYDGTISYTIAGVNNQYPLKRLTITDCVNRVLELAEPIYFMDNMIGGPRFTFDSAQAEKYDKIFAPEFSMTQCTLREQLQVIGAKIHAEPRLTENNTIVFDEYGGNNISDISSKPYIYKGYANSLNEYCTMLDTTAQNLVNTLDYDKAVVYDPGFAGFKSLRANSVYERIEDTTSNGIIQTQLPIYTILGVKCGVRNSADNGWSIDPIDVTSYVFEKTKYDTLSSHYGAFPYSKIYALYFERGTKNISGLFYKAPNAISETNESYSIVKILAAATGKTEAEVKALTPQYTNLVFQVAYLPIYETRYTQGKGYVEIGSRYSYTQIYNQEENLIESNWYGENIKGVALRLGNISQTRTYLLSDILEIPNAGELFIDEDEEYYIAGVNVSIMPLFIKCTISLSQDFNRLSEYVGISSYKRTAEISESQAYKRNILLKEYVLIGEETTSDSVLLKDVNSAFSWLSRFYTSEQNKLTVAKAYGKINEETTLTLNKVSLPLVSSAFGNNIVFTWQYKDNYSAGEQSVFYENISDDINGNWSEDYEYGDYYGHLKWYYFGLYPSDTVDTLSKANALPGTSDFDIENAVIGTRTGLFETGAYLVEKDSKEILQFNVAIEFVSNRKGLIIGSGLAKYCPLVSGNENKTPKFYVSNNRVNKFAQNIQDLEGITQTLSPNYSDHSLYFASGGYPASGKAWVLAMPTQVEKKTIYDSNTGETAIQQVITGGEILLAYNGDFNEGEAFEPIYFTSKRNIFS